MGRIILVGAPESWERFAREALEAAGKSTVSLPQDKILDSTLGRTISRNDLMIFSPSEGHLPSSDLGMLFRAFGPLRILVVDSHEDYTRAGDALRGCAVGYEVRPWNEERLVRLVEDYQSEEPPDPYTLDRRFGPCRAAL